MKYQKSGDSQAYKIFINSAVNVKNGGIVFALSPIGIENKPLIADYKKHLHVKYITKTLRIS